MLLSRKEFFRHTGEKSVSIGLNRLVESEKARRLFSERFDIALPTFVIFHGSPRELNVINPNVSEGGWNQDKELSLVYASPDPNYAIFLALIDLQDTGRATVTSDENGETLLAVNTDFVNGESKIGKGYVYALDGAVFAAQDNNEFTSEGSDLKPIFSIEVGIDDLSTPIHIRNWN